MHQHIKFGKLFLHDPSASRHESELFLATRRASEATKIMVMIDFPKTRQDQSGFIDTLVKEAVDVFDRSDETNPELLLEQILEALNALLPDLIAKKNRDWLKDLNALVGLTDNGQVHFSIIGDIQAWLLHDGLLSQIASGPATVNPLKLFANVTSGVLNPDDVLLCTTPALTDYISEVKIKHIVGNYGPLEAIRHLEDLLGEVPAFVTFNALLIKFIKVAGGVLGFKKQTEQTLVTEDGLLAEAGLPPHKQLRWKFPKGRGLLRTGLGQRRHSGWAWTTFKRGAAIFGKNAASYFSLVGQLIGRLGQAILTLIKLIVSSDFRRRQEKQLWDNIDSSFSNLSHNLQKLSRLKKILLIACGLIILVFINIIIFRGQIYQGNKVVNVFNEAIVTLNNLQTEVDSARLIKDDVKAENLLLQMQSLLDSLTITSPEQDNQVKQLQETFLRQLTDVRKITYVEAPLVFKDVSSLQQNTLGLTLINNQPYLLTDHGIYLLEAEPRQLASLDQADTKLVANRDKEKIFLLADKTLKQLVADKLTNSDLNLNQELQTIEQALIYGDNLYLLDRSRGAIFKHTSYNNGSNFRAGEFWLDDPNLVKTVQSFAIDGDIYVITDQGEIIKLFKGQRQTFNYQKPVPAFGGGSQIYTTASSDYLYILDPQNKRVAIINKDGRIKDQFTSSKFDDLKTLAIDSDEKTIYLLNGNNIYLLAIKK